MERKLRYLWTAVFYDGTSITQPQDDKYSKHDDSKEYNPSSFRDVIEYSEKSPIWAFIISNPDDENDFYGVRLVDGMFCAGGKEFALHKQDEKIVDKQIIYYRTMQANMQTGKQRCVAYNIGYKGKDPATGKTTEKVITVYE